MDPIEYLGALRRRWLVIVAALALSGLLGYGFALTTAPPEETPQEVAEASYSATAYLIPAGGTTSGLGNIHTVGVLAPSGEVAGRAARKLRFDGDPSTLSSQVQFVPNDDTGLLQVIAFANSAERAEELANVFATETVDWTGEVGPELAPDGVTGGRLALIQEATATLASPPTEGPLHAPTSATGKIVLALVLGLVTGIGLALIIDRVDFRIRTKADAEEHFGKPVVAELPQLSRRERKRGGIPASHSRSHAAEAYRLLATAVSPPLADPHSPAYGNGSAARNGKVILVTSSIPGEGKSSIVANLAVACAEMGKRVLVVSCDFRRPTVHELLSVSNHTGLSDAMNAPLGSEKILKSPLDPSNLYVIPSGPLPARPGEVLNSPAVRLTLADARSRADIIIIDSPPLLANSDAALLLSEIDAVLMVAKVGATRPAQAAKSTEILERLNADVVGVALNGASVSSLHRKYYQRETNSDDGGRRGIPRLVRHQKVH